MTRIEELELAVASLPQEEYIQFRHWFLQRDWESWDREIEADSAAGKLDFLLYEADEAKKQNQLRDLRDASDHRAVLAEIPSACLTKSVLWRTRVFNC